MKVALVHDWITGLRGGERCLLAFLELYPNADIFTLIHVPGTTDPKIDQRVVKTSFLQKIPNISKSYRYFLPLYPIAIKQFNFEGYDLVISLSHAAAKNIEVPDGVTHICYCFTPMRYIWDQAYSYFGKLTPFLWPILKVLRWWDLRKSIGVTKFVAISNFVAARIRCFYNRDSDVIYPPVDTAFYKKNSSATRGKAFLYAGALVPYKRVDLIVKAFQLLKEEIWIVGSGPEEQKLREIAGENVKFFGKVSDEEFAECYRNCRALIFAAKEDFGIVPIECFAAGRPVIAAYEGALRETHLGVKPWKRKLPIENSTGVFFKASKNQVKNLANAIRFFIEHESEFSPEFCQAYAKKFSKERFFEEWYALLESLDIVYDDAHTVQKFGVR